MPRKSGNASRSKASAPQKAAQPEDDMPTEQPAVKPRRSTCGKKQAHLDDATDMDVDAQGPGASIEEGEVAAIASARRLITPNPNADQNKNKGKNKASARATRKRANTSKLQHGAAKKSRAKTHQAAPDEELESPTSRDGEGSQGEGAAAKKTKKGHPAKQQSHPRTSFDALESEPIRVEVGEEGDDDDESKSSEASDTDTEKSKGTSEDSSEEGVEALELSSGDESNIGTAVQPKPSRKRVNAADQQKLATPAFEVKLQDKRTSAHASASPVLRQKGAPSKDGKKRVAPAPGPDTDSDDPSRTKQPMLPRRIKPKAINPPVAEPMAAAATPAPKHKGQSKHASGDSVQRSVTSKKTTTKTPSKADGPTSRTPSTPGPLDSAGAKATPQAAGSSRASSKSTKSDRLTTRDATGHRTGQVELAVTSMREDGGSEGSNMTDAEDEDEDVKPDIKPSIPSSVKLVDIELRVIKGKLAGVAEQTEPVKVVMKYANTRELHRILCWVHFMPRDLVYKDELARGALIVAMEKLGQRQVEAQLRADQPYATLMGSLTKDRMSSIRNDLLERTGKVDPAAYDFTKYGSKEKLALGVGFLMKRPGYRYIFPGKHIHITDNYDTTSPFCHKGMIAALRATYMGNKPKVRLPRKLFTSSIAEGPRSLEPELPAPMVAFHAVAVLANLKDWQNGVEIPLHFNTSDNSDDSYNTAYKNHMSTLVALKRENPDSYHDVMHYLYMAASNLIPDDESADPVTDVASVANPEIVLATVGANLKLRRRN
ncbi:hypothetical protein BV25DRAFT_1921091 [Artomyces pyxidatus]|uniref:Uncharacterized protein n=1 Tax=Artomyces pyxidatus TaxID=48021 RepID=A0ACB8SIJ8_9AGAM|nr:hypothetical protein BV25DRAFT_1921091 [Artomyces pyxidatus]